MSYVEHEKLVVYRLALEFIVLADNIIEEKRYISGRELLIRIVSMLIKLAQSKK